MNFEAFKNDQAREPHGEISVAFLYNTTIHET
jgi:hypothetical protein